MSENAMMRELSRTRVAGISPAAMLQNRQSATKPILTVAPPGGPLTYMVAVLRTLGAPPLLVHGPAPAGRSCREMRFSGGREDVNSAHEHGCGGGGIVQTTRRVAGWRQDPTCQRVNLQARLRVQFT
jgi:hypothetical protein